MVTDQQITADEARTIALGLIEAYNAHDPEGVVSYCTSDVTWDNPIVENPLQGHKAVAEQLRAEFRAFPDFHLDELEAYPSADGTEAAMRWRATATMTGPLEPPGLAATGKPINIAGMSLYRFTGTKVSEKIMFYDGLDLARQMRVLPQSDRIAVLYQKAATWWDRRRSRS